jgi:hypothetical protein
MAAKANDASGTFRTTKEASLTSALTIATPWPAGRHDAAFSKTARTRTTIWRGASQSDSVRKRSGGVISPFDVSAGRFATRLHRLALT